MNRNKLADVLKILAVVLVVNLGVWGCSRQPVSRNGSADRARALETRCVKLENDFRTMLQDRDRARAEAARQESEAARLQKDLTERKNVARERDALLAQLRDARAQRDNLSKALVERNRELATLKDQVSQRTTERDQSQARLERVRKSLQTLLTDREDGPQGIPTSAPATPAAAPASANTTSLSNVEIEAPALAPQR